MSTITLNNPDVNQRKTEFLKFLKGCQKEEKFTKKEEKVETARLNPVEEIKTDEQKNEYCRNKKSDKDKINTNHKKKQVKKKLCISKTTVLLDCTIKLLKVRETSVFLRLLKLM